ncbi:MAG: hypothetical protein ABI443_01715 [Chthoniobacterales bacterium]
MRNLEFLEILEPRIAPASIYNAGPSTIGSTPTGFIGYTDIISATPFVATNSGSADPGISALFAGAAWHYYITLKPADILNLYNPSGGSLFQQLLKSNASEVTAFFYDANHDGLVQANELSGLSLGAKSSVIVGTSINGDVVSNWNATTHMFSETSIIGDTQTIAAINVSGSISGSIVAGGSIGGASNTIHVVGNVVGIKAGSAVGAYTYNFGGGDPGAGVGQATLVPIALPAAHKAGASITGVSVVSLGTIQAGDGGAGGVGGNLTNINISSDSDGYSLFAGNGGAGISASTSGGVGGAVTSVVIGGVIDSAGNLAEIHSGNGGDAFTGSTGKGGNGGLLQKVYVGYEYATKNAIIQSINLAQDMVYVQAGNGGTGVTGGVGGAISTVNIATTTPFTAGGIPNPYTGPAYQTIVHAGDGGDTLAATNPVAGAGGAVSAVQVRNFLTDTSSATHPYDIKTWVSAGDGGITASGKGGNGGAVTNVIGLAYSLTVNGGNGSTGTTTGGNGGAVTNVSLEFQNNILIEELLVNAGTGGNTTTGNAGAGGNLTTVKVPFGDMFTSAFSAGDAGSAFNGKGGKGGTLNSVGIYESPLATVVADTITFSAGAGGSGGLGGGIGGDLIKATFQGTQTDVIFNGGAGGDALTNGSGGNAGKILSIVGTSSGLDSHGNQSTGLITSGVGGAGMGTGKGGAGGTVTTATLDTSGDAIFTAGAGGSAVNGLAGVGGSLISTVIITATGDASLTSGAGGAGTVKGGAGGNITTSSISALGAVSLQGGAGDTGGLGGSVSKISISGFDTDSPGGDISIHAGAGSASATTAGVGGSLISITTTLTSDATGQNIFTAGVGGSGTKGANGGNITGLNINAGGSGGMTIINAGDGGTSTGSSVGGKGGNVTGVNSADTHMIQQISAGDGGNSGTGAGGTGGNVGGTGNTNRIGTSANIGFLSQGATPHPYGFVDFNASGTFDNMGGIFAGQGGTGAKVGAAGNVTNVDANAISSIVAGKASSPQLVTSVSQIILGNPNTGAGLQNPVPQSTSYLAVSQPNHVDPSSGVVVPLWSWTDGNVVGGIAGDPTAAGASTFKLVSGTPWVFGSTWVVGTTQPLDGLIAALTINSKTNNFIPEAILTMDQGQTVFIGQRVPTS